jgi:hypothetical protein
MMNGTGPRGADALPPRSLPRGVDLIRVTRADDCGLEVSDPFLDLGEAVQAVARHMARTGVYEIRVSYLAG